MDGQFLFIRIRKWAKMVSSGIEMRENEPLLDNILNDCLWEVLEDKDTDSMFERLK